MNNKSIFFRQKERKKEKEKGLSCPWYSIQSHVKLIVPSRGPLLSCCPASGSVWTTSFQTTYSTTLFKGDLKPLQNSNSMHITVLCVVEKTLTSRFVLRSIHKSLSTVLRRRLNGSSISIIYIRQCNDSD